MDNFEHPAIVVQIIHVVFQDESVRRRLWREGGIIGCRKTSKEKRKTSMDNFLKFVIMVRSSRVLVCV